MTNPYYIMAPDYTEVSAGVHVLYTLCAKLNRLGFDAYMVGSEKTNDSAFAPILNDPDVSEHIDRGLNPIAVYPEIISGNPLGCNVCVRYMLNKEGVIRGNDIEASDSDIFFYYAEPFMDGQEQLGHRLEIPIIDLSLFSPPESSDFRFRSLLYLNRYSIDDVDFDSLPADVEILSMANALSHEELATRLKQAKVIYSYEYSMTCTMAMLCGCPLVVKGFESGRKYGFSKSMLSVYKGLGFAFSDDSESLQIAERGLVEFRKERMRQEALADVELQNFVELTQKAALEAHTATTGRLHRTPLAHWCEARTLNEKQYSGLRGGVTGANKICIVIVDENIRSDHFVELINTYRSCRDAIPNLSCVILTKDAGRQKQVDLTGVQLRTLGPNFSSEAITLAVREIDSSWFVVLDSQAALRSAGMLMLVAELQAAPESCIAVYGDELISNQGNVSGALLRPDFNLDMLLSNPTAIAKHWFFKREAFLDMGGFDASLNSAFELDLILRILESSGFGAFGHVTEPVLLSEQETACADGSETKKVILEHLRRRGYSAADVLEGYAPATFDVSYGLPDTPSVSIVVIATDQLARLQTCIESILEKTDYAYYEILLFDNNSKTPETRAWFDGLASMDISNIRVLKHSHTVSYSVSVNKAIAEARGEYLVLLASDIGIIRKDWLHSLLNHAQRPEVGIVGAKVLAADGKVHSAGIVAGLNGVAGRTFVDAEANALGYMSRLQVDQNCSLVPDDCMVFSRTMFDELGGFDESLGDFLGGADFCLRAGHSGRLNVWTPRAVVMRVSADSQVSSHPAEHSRLSSSRAESENLMYDRWLPQLANDPSYNRNFALTGAGFEVEQRIDLSWQPHKLLGQPTILVYPADQWGCGHYRMMQPLEAMKAQNVAGGMIAREWLTVPELAKLDPDTCIYQRQITDEAITSMKQVRRFLKKPVVYELDDYLPNLPLKSAYRKNMPRDILKSLRRSLKHVDRFVVSTNPLAEAFKGIHSDIRVVENRLPLGWWQDLNSLRRQSDNPRVGWAGGIGHTGDLELVEAVVRDLSEEVDWVFFGMCPDSLRPFVKEVHEGVDIALYPQKLASMNLDLAIAPLEDNLFNRCKSNLRLLEYGACGFPVVCSDVEPYRMHNLPVTRVKNRYKDWMDAIRMHLSDLDETARQGDELKSVILRDWMLEGENLRQWLRAWTKF